ncbi:MAG: 4Fe-4S binding protein [Candidatus Thermoplasmatota archaeon]
MGEKYHGIPREEIQWFPTIDREKCSGCGVCVEFCHRKVYSWVDGAPAVSSPYSCVVGCTGCQGKCESGAISFPTLRKISEELRALKAKHQHDGQ